MVFLFHNSPSRAEKDTRDVKKRGERESEAKRVMHMDNKQQLMVSVSFI